MNSEVNRSGRPGAAAALVEQYLDYLSGERPDPPTLDALDPPDRERANQLIDFLDRTYGLDSPGAPPVERDRVLDRLDHAASVFQLHELVREVPDFPVPGVLFRDTMQLYSNWYHYSFAAEEMARQFHGAVDQVVGIEARGFVLATLVADRLKAGLVLFRKKPQLPKLPFRLESQQYETEYEASEMQAQADALQDGGRVLVVDDVVATGGTVSAAAKLVDRLGGKVTGVACLIELRGFEARRRMRTIVGDDSRFISVLRY